MKYVRILLAIAVVAIVAAVASAQAQERTYLYSYGGPEQTPGHPIVLAYDTDLDATHAVRVVVYRLPREQYVDLIRNRGGEPREQDVRDLPVVARAQSRPPNEGRAYEREVLLDALPIGEYAVVARGGDGVVVSSFQVTTLGVAQARSYPSVGDAIYFPTDLRTYRRYPATVDLRVIDDAGVHAVTEEGGIGRFAEKTSGNAVLVASAPDGSLAVESVDSGNTKPGETGYVQADRPIYRPGDTISLRAILRDGSIGSYTVPSGSRRVQVSAPDGSNVYDHDAPLTSFGTLAASVRLPEDAQTGSYSVSIGDDVNSAVVVAAYKKPEYELAFSSAPDHVTGGASAAFAIDAKYFFGRPAAGMKLHYTVYSEPHFYEWWFGPYRSIVQSSGLWNRSGREDVLHGDVMTGEDGRAAFSVATAATKEDRDYSVQVDARDASGRTVTLSSSMLVTAASFQISVSPQTWIGQAGEASTILVRSRLYGGDGETPRPDAAIHIDVTGRRWENGKEITTSQHSFDVSTGADGNASIDWTPPGAGDFQIVATAKDESGNATMSSTYLWVLGSGDESYFAPIEQPMLIPDKQSVAPGGTVKVAIALPKAGRDVLLLVSTDRLGEARVVHAIGTTTSVSVEAPRDATTFGIAVILPGENGVEQAQTTIKVLPPARALHVTIAAVKKKYAPGDRATFDVRVVDDLGRPQRAELGIGVVDESIYAVQAEDATDPLDAFYAGRANVWGSANWFRPNRGMQRGLAGGAEIMKSGTVADVYSVNAANPVPAPPGRAGVSVRSNFLDTAYWSPTVVTGDDGRATIGFTWPDNLTTWRATGVGVTESGDIGKGAGSALVTKDFLVRLEMPRFLRAGDRSSIVGIAHGLASAPNVRMQLDAGALAKDPLVAALKLDRFQSATASWPVTAPGTGLVMLTLSGTDGVLSDAMRLPLPLEAGTAAEHVRDAGSLATRATLEVKVPPGYLGGALHLTLSPSLIAELVQNQRLLDVYPYYCTEQTMSAGLPAVFIGRVLHGAHLKAPSDVDIAEIVRHAIARLNQLQHGDGSWGWWEYDAGHPFMTAYALYGLAEFKKDGYSVPQSMLDRGVDSLVNQLGSANGETLRFWGGAQPGSEWNTRAFMFYSLADAAPARVDRAMLAQTRAHVGELNPYAIAVLGLAEHWLGDEDAAKSLLIELHKRAIRDGAFTYWRGSTWHYAWEDDPIETTAYALRFEVAMGEGATQTDPTVNFLRAQRRGNWWYTTKDTAAAIYALSQTIRPDSSEFTPDETVRVLLDGREVRSLHVTQAILDAADASVVVPASSLREGGTVTFERTGRGALYWASDAVRYVPVGSERASDASQALLARLFAAPPSLTVDRRYTLKHGGPWRVGDEVIVDVTVRSRADVQYVAVEDPFPAGAEHQPEQGHAGDDAWSGVQLLDDRAVFFADRLYPDYPMKIRYTLRVTTPGHYTAPSPTVYAMYGPPVSALGKPQDIEVVP
jgi:alpha-2-macroglobulin